MVVAKNMAHYFIFVNLSRTVLLLVLLSKLTVVCQVTEDITQHPQSQRVTEGATVTLACEFSRQIQFSLDERIIWYKNGSAITFNDRVVSTENPSISVTVSNNYKRFDLLIGHASIKDTGVYFCYFTLTNKNVQSKSAILAVGSVHTPKHTDKPESTDSSNDRVNNPATARPVTDDITNDARPTAVFVSITTSCLALVLLAIIVLWIFKVKRTEANTYVNNLITMPISCLKKNHDEDELGKVPSTSAFDDHDDVFVNKNTSDMFLISDTTNTSDKRVQNEYYDISSLVPAGKNISKQPQPLVSSNSMKDRMSRNVEGLTYAQLDLKEHPKTIICSDIPRTQYAVISL